MPYFHGKWNELTVLEGRLNQCRYGYLLLLDTSILVNGRINSKFSGEELKEQQLGQIANGNGFGKTLDSQGLSPYHKEQALNGGVNSIAEYSRYSKKITDTMVYWKQVGFKAIPVITDFVQNEAGHVADTKFAAHRNELYGWLDEIQKRDGKSAYVFLNTIFSGLPQNKEGLEFCLEDCTPEHYRLAKLMKDDCDRALVLTAIYLADNTKMTVGIVNDNPTDFNAILKTGLEKYSQMYGNSRTRIIKCYNSKECWETLYNHPAKIWRR
jgi:hypothetical protein